MSRFIISFAFTVLLVGVVHAQSEETFIADKCYQKWRIRADLERSCRKSIKKFNNTAIAQELETYIIQYSGDNAAINSLADEYCPIFKSILECGSIPNELDEECQTALEKEQDQQNDDITKGLLNYMCVGSGAAIIQLLQNDGLQTVYENKQFRQCHDLLYNKADAMIADKIQPYIVTCESVNVAYKCYIDYVRDHANLNLPTIANDVRLIFREVLKCGPENEL